MAEETTYVQETDNITLAHEFIKVMSPLIPPGRMSMELLGSPEREIEIETNEQLIELAKEYKLHRKIKHAQCGVIVHFKNESTIHLNGPFLHINANSLSIHDSYRRIVIIYTLYILLIITLLKVSIR